MPAAPEVLDRDRCVRRVEVLREPEPEQQRDPDRHVGVAREVRVDLHGVRVDRDQDLERRVLTGRGEDLVHDRRGEVVRDHHLLEEARGDQVEGAARVDAPRIPRCVDLRDQLRGPDDRPCHEVREEREVHRELLEGRRLEVAAVRVDDVADRHEGVERDADRKHDRLQAERHVHADRRREVVGRRDEEVVVLEVAEHREVAGERQPQAARDAATATGCARCAPRAPGSRACTPRAGRRTASPTTSRRRSSRR